MSSTPQTPDTAPTVTSDAKDAHTFYNSVPVHGLDHRNDSPIFYLRNFNNWIKSTLIDEYLTRLRSEQRDRRNDIHVFDMGCGKGGDQSKWHIGKVKHVTFADLAENLVEQCRNRYRDRQPCYGANFFPFNCTTELLRDKIESTKPCFDLVSTQFVLHYAFDKIESADRFLRNAAEFLRDGGYFIGTTVNSCRLVELCRQSPNQTISNDVFKIHFDSSIDLSSTNNESIPLFGAKYDFSLDEVVDCAEYLVYYPLLKELAKKHGLEAVDRQTFKEYFDRHATDAESRALLARMKALECYELPREGATENQRTKTNPEQYQHGIQYITEKNGDRHPPLTCCRTLSKQEWDMTSLYITFAFRKTNRVVYEDTKSSLE